MNKSTFLFPCLPLSVITFAVCCHVHALAAVPASLPVLTPENASGFARLALKCVRREYPNKPDHVMNDSSDVRNPGHLHPAFFGCFDWHSSVHGHWMLVRILKSFPALTGAADIENALETNLTPENILQETLYLQEANRKSFERTYGWAWLLKLAEELMTWNDPRAQKWSQNLAPLVDEIVHRYMNFLPGQTYPIRRGVHPNTAFGIAFALDYAAAAHNQALEKMLIQRTLDYYGKDRECPARWEPDGDDFFSPCLMEASLMSRILPDTSYLTWLRQFLPGLITCDPRSLFYPAEVSDRSDPKIVHLDGLNLSRAWCMAVIASALPDQAPERRILTESANRHASATLPFIAAGHYEGEHWLASFAVYMLIRFQNIPILQE